MTFTLLPAVDVSQGQAVRLDKGEAGTETSYGSPRDAAQKWQSQGAHLSLIHISEPTRPY